MQQSYRHVFVTNSPVLLAQGATVERIAVGQIGILDAKTNTATTAPTYAKNKAIKIVHGTPDLGDVPLMSGQFNQNDYSKLIKGKLLTGFRGHAASRPQTEIWTVGWSGDEGDTDTLFAKNGETKHLFIKLTGGPIDKLYSKQGLVRQFSVQAGTVDDCGDPCEDVDCQLLVDDLVKQINSDPAFSSQGRGRLIKVSSQVFCDTPADVDSDTDYVFSLTVCDTADDQALGFVQSQYPDDTVKRVSTNGSFSTYEIVRDTDSLPSAYSNAGVVLVPDCPFCPSGYTYTADGGFAYSITRSDAGTSGALTTLKSDYSLTGAEIAARVQYEYGSSTYVVVSTTALTAVGTPPDTLVFLGNAQNSCVLTTPSEVAWLASGTLTKFGKDFRITLADDICGNTRLADLQAAFPDLTIAVVTAGGDCVHTYETTVFSQAVEEGCSLDTLYFDVPASFEGIDWVEQPSATGTGCRCGLRFEVAFVNRLTNECTFDHFPYDAETIHIQISSFDPNYNANPDAEQWAVKKIQSYKHPSGYGAYVRQLEKESNGYNLRDRSFDPVVRELNGYSFQAVPDKYYDEYVLEFDFSYEVGGWAQKYTDTYSLSVFFPEGNGGNFESAINSYIASSGIQIDPVHL